MTVLAQSKAASAVTTSAVGAVTPSDTAGDVGDSWSADLTGRVALRLRPAPDGRGGERTTVVEQAHAGALRIIRPLYLDDTGEASVTLVNPGGGYLGGDRYRVDLDLEPSARAVVTTQSATRVYRTPGTPATSTTFAKIGAGSVLTYVPHALIAYADAEYRQHLHVDLHPEGTLFATDVITPGWSPDGRPFRYRRIHTHVDVRQADRLALRDVLVLDAGLREGGPHGPGATHVGSLLALSPHCTDADVDALRELTAQATGVRAGVSRLDRPGLLLRALGTSTDDLDALLRPAVDLLRAAWTDQPPVIYRTY